MLKESKGSFFDGLMVLEWRKNNYSLIRRIKPVIEGLGFSLVEFTCYKNRDDLNVNIIIYSKVGVSIGDCSTIFKTIRPKIELLEDTRNLSLEVSSPGIMRNIKTVDEFEVFIGKKVKILKKNEIEWICGSIQSADNDSVTLNIENQAVDVSFEDISKAKLE